MKYTNVLVETMHFVMGMCISNCEYEMICFHSSWLKLLRTTRHVVHCVVHFKYHLRKKGSGK